MGKFTLENYFFIGFGVGVAVQVLVSLLLCLLLTGCTLPPVFWAHEAEKVVEDVVEAEEDHHA